MSVLKRDVLLATTAFGVLLAGSLGSPSFARAQESVEAQKPSEVVVTGSRIRRAATDTSAPIDLIGAQDLADRGFTNIGEALNKITANTPSIPETPSASGPAGPGQSFPNLFNLGQGRTLSLVDGRRFVSSATPVTGASSGAGNGVDTNLIPIGLLDHVEVVEAGGAAVYGSDAIAGVVNYILKKNFTGAEVDVQTGISSRGDHAESSARATFGNNFADGKGNIAVDLEWSKTDPLLMSDRNFAAIGRSTAGTVAIPNAHFYEFSTNGVIFTAAAPTPVCGGLNCFLRVGGVPQQFSTDGTTLIPYNSGINAANGATLLTPPFAVGGDGYPLANLTALETGVERYTGNLLAHYDFSPHLRLSGSLLYGHTRGDDPAGSQGYSQTILNNAASGAGPILFNKNNPYLTPSEIATLSAASATFASGGNLNLSKNFPDILPTRDFITSTDNYRGLIQLDGDFNRWGRNFYYSASFSHGQVRSEQDGWSVYTARFANAINSTKNAAGQIVCAINATTVVDPNCAPINPFGVNVSAAARAYVAVPVGYTYNNKQDDFLATLGGDVIRLPAGESKFSVAYEHRSESASYTPAEANHLGLVGSGVATPITGGSYETNEYSGEILIPILGRGFSLPFAKTVEFSAQGRLVDNSVSGQNKVWGLGLRWEVVDGLTFRFSRSQNFRAPTLYQLNAPSSTALAGGIQDPCDSRYINAGAAPTTRAANCLALFQANPLYGTGSAGSAPIGADAVTRLKTFTDTAVNFSTALVTSGGNPTLKNEVSETITYGGVFQPRWVPGRLTITLDYISVNLTNGLTGFTPTNFSQSCFDATGANGSTCSFFTRDAVGNIATAASTTYNAASLKYQGETVNADYRFPVEWLVRRSGWGDLELQLEATHNEKLRQNVSGAITQIVGTIAEPRWVTRGDVRYTRGPLRLTYEAYYLPSAYAVQGANAANNAAPYIDSNLRHSISATYDFGRFQIRGGIDNLTDKLVSDPTLNYGDVIGRTYFLGVKARY